jgi:hypothetical protein
MSKLSKETIEVLSNFSTINPNLVVKKGNVINTISEAKNILAIAKVEETFESDFGIYDLNEFINVLNLVDEPDLDFSENSVTLKGANCNAVYRFADESILTSPTQKLNMPDADVEVLISGEVINQIRKASSVLNHSIVSLKGSGGKVELVVNDPNNPTANTYNITLDEDNDCKQDFDFQFLISNFKLIGGDYKVKISSKLISNWSKVSDGEIEYYIALEKTSTFG